MLLSVIIPTYHRNDLLAKCLDRIAPPVQNLDRQYYEVIVSDDGNLNNAEKLLKEHYPWVKWVSGPKRGPAANRNNGSRYAKGEWLVFTDDDCLPESDWLFQYFEAIKAYPDCKAFEGAILPETTKEVGGDMVECPINTTGGNFWSANVMIEKATFLKINGFEESYLIAAQEDQDIYLKLKKVSAVKFLSNCIIYHPIRKISLLKKISRIKIESDNWMLYCKKNKINMGVSSDFEFIKSDILTHSRVLLQSVKKFHYKRAILSLAWLFYGIPYIFVRTIKK